MEVAAGLGRETRDDFTLFGILQTESEGSRSLVGTRFSGLRLYTSIACVQLSCLVSKWERSHR